jgi:hypothetical protein
MHEFVFFVSLLFASKIFEALLKILGQSFTDGGELKIISGERERVRERESERVRGGRETDRERGDLHLQITSNFL